MSNTPPTDMQSWMRRLAARVVILERRPKPRDVPTVTANPSASRAGAGAQIYRSDLSKPLWSNGTVWKDAAGTTVS